MSEAAKSTAEAKASASPFGGDSSSSSSAESRHTSSSVSEAEASKINALCSAAWRGVGEPLMAQDNLNFVRFTGFVIDQTTKQRCGLFVVPKDDSAAAAATTATATATTATGAHAKGAHANAKAKVANVTFQLLPLTALHGVDLSNAAAVEALAVRPLFYAAAAGHRASVQALISAYKQLDADCSSVLAAVHEAKPHPDRAGEWNLTGAEHTGQFDAATVARANGFHETAELLDHPNSRSCTDTRSCGQSDCTLM